MKKFRDWMHGKGRNIVIAVVLFVAVCIVIHYFVVERDCHIGPNKPNTTVTPKSPEEENLGGDSIGGVKPGTTMLPGDAISPSASASPKTSAAKGGLSTKVESKAGQESDVITLGFAGDICLDDTSAVMRHMKNRGGMEKVISKRLIKKMNAYDAMVINNEFSISNRGQAMAGKAYTFRSKPSNIKYLKKLGVDVAGLANNHVYDFGKSAFLDTLKYLKKADIQTMGAGENIAKAKKPVYLTIKGKKIAIIAATRAEKYILTPEAGKKTPGVFRTYDDKAYVKAIKKAKKNADYVIAYVHWGTEYSTTLEREQKQQAKDYINAGADAIVGAHTHCMQGIGYYKKKPVFYSLGNFWFNERTLYTTVLELTIDKKGKLQAKMQPCLQKGKETKLLTSKKKIRKFVRYINSISTNGALDSHCNVKMRKS